MIVICDIHDTANPCTKQSKARYTLGGGEKINHLLFINNSKLYRKSENEIKGLVSTVEVFSKRHKNGIRY